MHGRIVVYVGNTLYPFFLNKVRNTFNKSCLVYGIRNFRDLYLIASVWLFNDFRTSADSYFSSACSVRRPYSGASHYNTRSREVRSGDMLHKLGKPNIRIIYDCTHSADNLTEIVRRNICSHTYGDTH